MIIDSKNSYKVEVGRKYFDELLTKRAVIELKEKRLKRSLDENGLYWLWLTAIQTEIQQDKNELHFLYRCLFLQRDEDYILKIIKQDLWIKIKKYITDFRYFEGLRQVADVISRSTTELDESIEFPKYLKEIQNHARVYFSIILLNREEKNFADFYREYGFR